MLFQVGPLCVQQVVIIMSSDEQIDYQPDCFICGQQLFDDDLANALENYQADDYACSQCLAAADSTGQGFEN